MTSVPSQSRQAEPRAASSATQPRFVSRSQCKKPDGQTNQHHVTKIAVQVRPSSTPLRATNPFVHRPRKIEKKREGYPRLSAFVNSDKDFAVFKRFGQLHARVLLHKQDELMEIEEQIDDLDEKEAMAFYLRSRRLDTSVERRKLLADAEQKLLEYNRLVESYFSQIERPRPREQNIRSVSNWLDGNKPLSESESAFLGDWDDLIAPKTPEDYSGLHQYLETLAVQMIKRGLRKREVHKSDDDQILFLSQLGIATAARALTTFLAVVTLVGPIAVLYCVESDEYKLWIIALFTLGFASVLSLTQSRHYEIFTATAAYTAVMVVFFGNLPSGNNA